MEALKNVFEKKKQEVCICLLVLETFCSLTYKNQGSPALVTFVTAGYPRAEDTVPILLAMQEGGADILELGIPFSDPMADGPAIQETNSVRLSNFIHCVPFHVSSIQIALKNGVDYARSLGMLVEARSRGLTAPVLLMGSLRI